MNTTRSQKILFNTAWFVCAVLLILLLPSLLSYNNNDPAWSRYSGDTNINNLMGKFGAYTADIIFYLFGYSAYWFIVLLIVMFVVMWRRSNYISSSYEFDIINGFSFAILILSSSTFEHAILNIDAYSLPQGAGGMIGEILSFPCLQFFGFTGSALILFALICISFAGFLEFSWLNFAEKIGIISNYIWLFFKKYKNNRLNADFLKPVNLNVSKKSNPEIIKKENSKNLILGNIIPKKIFSNLPKLDVWKDEIKTHSISEDSLTFTSKVIEHRLNSFGLQVQVVSVHPGPVITLFELQLPSGVRSAQISSLSRDIARELSVPHIRIVANLPNKSTIGLELPNNLRQNIYMRQLIMGILSQQEPGLFVALGVKSDNQPVYIDLCKMPHCLIAGSSGTGKSVLLHAVITSLLAKMLPQDLRLVLIDTKMIEMTAYKEIPHLLMPIITDTINANKSLEWLVQEMERRYNLMSKCMVRNINIYNQKIKDKDWIVKNKIKNPTHMTYIVVVIDELSDLMLSSSKLIEINIIRLTQKARAVGIHLVISTQRTTNDVITALIKANIQSRISLQVASKLDSKIILDQLGAEGLLGKGDMLYLEAGNPNPTRIHGVFVDDDEIIAISQFWREQGSPNYITLESD